MLMALTSAFLALGLQHLNTRFMVKTLSSFTFTFHKLHKAWKKRKSPPFVGFHSFEEDSSLCVVAVLNEYLKRSEKWRTSDERQLLLIVWIKITTFFKRRVSIITHGYSIDLIIKLTVKNKMSLRCSEKEKFFRFFSSDV